MAFDVDALVDRRRLKRRVAFWRFTAIAVFILLLISLLVRASGFAGNHVARITVADVIADNPARIELLDRIAKDDNVKALIVQINSPGGTITGSEELYHALRRVAEKKPVVSVIGSVPLMVCDVWEHAYYLTHQNNRGAYVDAFLANLVSWTAAEARLAAAMG